MTVNHNNKQNPQSAVLRVAIRALIIRVATRVVLLITGRHCTVSSTHNVFLKSHPKHSQHNPWKSCSATSRRLAIYYYSLNIHCLFTEYSLPIHRKMMKRKSAACPMTRQ
jgi:hypothetical protein